jgi:undecaprenyl diphosphate synthase
MKEFDIDTENLPSHIGIIMDGNGRWAKKRGKLRSAGHKEGLNAAKRIVKAAADLGIKYVTLYTFSTENWKRAEEEVSFLMRLISQHLKNENDFYLQNSIRVVHSGDIAGLPDYVQDDLRSVMDSTKTFNRTTVNLSINYGGRDEIVRSVNRWIVAGAGRKADKITAENIAAFLDCPDIPDPDLIIRTAGEIRLSNFLIWECAYSEFYFSSKLWPDIESADLYEAIRDYQHRIRNFGG